MEKRWKVLGYDYEKIQLLKKSLGIHSALCSILVQRGLFTFESAKSYFRPAITDLHDPWLMKDMDKAVQRIRKALNTKEKILVYGDYDVDGTTAVACMYHFLNSIHSDVEFYLPHRYKEGYGISKAGIDFASENKYTLIISLDCGIKATQVITYANSLGIDFVVCDHHMPDDILPPAVAILDTKQPGCEYPFKELCGCGVGFKLIQALCINLSLPDSTWMKYLDLVATAIAADIVPITGENRVLTYFGLEKVNREPCTGIKALMDLSSLTRKVCVTDLVFVVAPRINAAGRMDDARKAVLLFIEEDYTKAIDLARLLHTDNTERKEADTTTTEQALFLLDNDLLLQSKKTTVLYHKDWHKGVVGIVASRLIEKYYRPTIVLTSSGDKVSGSARSVIGYNVYEAIHQCKDLLENYGGHFYAAGLTMKTENVEPFMTLFEKVVNDTITEELLIPEIVIDGEVAFKDINETFYKIICQMEPFGPDNMRPVFIARQVYETGYSRIVKESHIKFTLKQENFTMEGIGFGLAGKFSLLQPNIPIDVVFTIDENEWNGEKKLQLRVIDFKKSFVDDFD
ncbi:MAG: single-stranded-DNA-specific exonuclease RecJ [Bacteroidota bacterium]